MRRIDWVIVSRLGASIALSIAVMSGIVALVESLNTSRFEALSASGGAPLALLAIVASSARWVLDALPLLVLIGAIIGLLQLQSSRQLTVIKAAGFSVWRIMRAPLAFAVLLGIVVALALDAGTVVLNRNLSPGGQQTNPGRLWFEERKAEVHYIVEAEYVHPGGGQLGSVNVFLLEAPRDRIEAETAQLTGGEWVMAKATRFRSNSKPEPITDFRLPSSLSSGDVRAKLASVNDMTVYELGEAIASRLTDPTDRAPTLTRFLKLLALPLTLMGSVVIAFAFTAGYRRTNKYGAAVLYGIALGFVLYVLAEMANRAGSAGAMQPAVAVIGPAVLAIVMGVTVLLNREDGRT
ncbi:LptF/LptG family permease [Devosia sp.]|uniref:LptF/LptG family permease n=1 Tax=Devosia sp. TaxID=1871048 RepID=UPI003BAB44A6